jgi:heme a synthase
VYRIVVLRRLALAAMLLAFCVVVFGAYVRLTDAGLGCPDWPGCYGHVTPAAAAAADAGTADAPLHLGKAWNEMIHRYGASTLGLVIVVMAAFALRWRRHVDVPVGLPLALVGMVIFQGMLGMWTVTLLLKPLIVSLHLVFGFTTLSMLWWLWLTLRRRSSDPWSGTRAALSGGSTAALLRPAPRFLRRVALVALIALVIQIMLGGWTSTNYAAVACPICRNARPTGGPKQTSAKPSCCGAGSASTMKVACWITRPGLPSISRIDWARWWHRWHCCLPQS